MGGTLSSYTWICLIINFLQTRNPPILPSLQARPHEKKISPEGLVCSFDDDLGNLTGYGRKNKQSLGDLFFQFFKYYGHELDYEKYVVSVREGKLISKEAKGWHLLQNNRLCVEEPFNTSRNLGNTADDTSFRGVHLELRRAFKAASQGDLELCCEQYEYPPEEERSWERPPPQPRPVLTAPPSSRGGRGGGRGGRNSHQYPRGGHNGSRRSSNTPHKSNNFRQASNGMSASELSLQAQQAQYLLHDHLYQQIQILQAQEQELRLQLQNQALLTGRPPPVLIRQPFIQFPMPQQQESTGDDNSRSRSGTANHAPHGTQLRQHVYYGTPYLPVAITGLQGSSTTNPPSPSAPTAMPELRRNPRRSSVANGSPGGSLRAQSQPARSVHSLPSFAPIYSMTQDPPQGSKQRNTPVSPDGAPNEEDNNFMPSSMPNVSRSPYLDESRPTEYMGYYLATSPQLQTYHQNAMLSPLQTPVGLALPNGGIMPFVANPQEYLSTFGPQDAFASSPDNGSTQASKAGSTHQRATARPMASGGPLIVDGSVPLSEPRNTAPSAENYDPYGAMSHCTSTSDDHNTDTPASVSDSFSQDYQDTSSVETDQTPYFGRQGIDTRKPADALTNGHGGKPSLLSSRLQSLHLSNSEKMAEPPSKLGPEKHKAAFSHQETSEKDSSRLRHTTAEKVMSGPELQGASNGKRRTNGVDVPEKVNGNSHKSKPKNRSDTSHPTGGPGDKERNGGHPRRTNGAGSTTHDSHGNHTSSGWQTTKKKQKKNARSNAESRHGFHGGAEPLPADESLRKGG